MQRLDVLLRLSSAEDARRDVLPMLYRGLDDARAHVHEACVRALPQCAALLEHAAVKHAVLPRVKRLCAGTGATSALRVHCLLCLAQLLDQLDKWLVMDELLPFLPQLQPHAARDPATLMAILGIYKLAMQHKKLGIGKEVSIYGYIG